MSNERYKKFFKEEYNGWTNYETWNVHLWITNEEGIYRAMVAGKPYTAKTAERFVRRIFPNGTPDMENRSGDYKKVNWQEIADAFNE